LCRKKGTPTAGLTKLANLIAERCADLAETCGAEEMGDDQIQLPGI
jgi:hypothetical protein